MTLHLQSCHTPLNAPQFSNLSVFCPLHIFTNQCVTSTFILHRPLLQQIFNVHSLNKKNTKTAQRMPSELSTDSTKTSTSSDSSTTTSKVHVKPITQLTLSNYFELCSFSVFLDFFRFCSVQSFSLAFFPFLILFYSRSHSIHSIHMGFCFASCWLSFLFCILLPFQSRPLACNFLFFFVI